MLIHYWKNRDCFSYSCFSLFYKVIIYFYSSYVVPYLHPMMVCFWEFLIVLPTKCLVKKLSEELEKEVHMVNSHSNKLQWSTKNDLKVCCKERGILNYKLLLLNYKVVCSALHFRNWTNMAVCIHANKSK